ncbi:MAG: hypothetical protein KKG75_00310 [Nanoarchaeota archaeon]|nr:hypothetical protein [Nanoarchaeota archaeon]
MKGKFVLIGGVSGVGKTTLAKRLCEVMGGSNIRFYHYILETARKKGIKNPGPVWELLLEESLPLIIEDIEREKFAVCDHHFAVQPIYDTAYALGELGVEDLDEPYTKGLHDGALKMYGWSRITVYPILLDAPTEHILSRRESLSNIKRPRSLNPLSVDREREYERRYFEEAADLLNGGDRNLMVAENKEGDFEQTFESVLEQIIE